MNINNKIYTKIKTNFCVDDEETPMIMSLMDTEVKIRPIIILKESQTH